MESRHIDRDGTRLHALWQPGIGPPLVIVPGVMTDAKGWRRVAAAIDSPAPILILNRRGREPSGPLGPGYGVETEVLDLLAWLDLLDSPSRLFGWSYGGSIALEAASRSAAVRHVLAYEPVLSPFGATALPALSSATEAGDLDRVVEVVNLDVSKYPPSHVAALRSSPAWAPLRGWAAPVAEELAALNAFTPEWPLDIPIDLIIGAHSRGDTPYGTAFTAVQELLPTATTHVLPGQGHLAHVEAPESLGHLLRDIIATRTVSPA